MLSILKKLNRIMDKSQKKKAGLLFLVTVISTFLEVLGVSLMIPLISAILDPAIIEKNRIIKDICFFLDIHSHRTFVIYCIALLIVTYVLKDLFLMFSYFLQAKFVYQNRYATAVKIFRVFLRKPYHYFLNLKSGEVLRILEGDVNQVYSLLMTIIGLFSEALTSVAIVTVIFLADPFMTVFVGLVMSLTLLLIAKVIRPILAKKGLEWQKYRALSNKWLLEGIHGIKDIKVSGKEDYFLKSFSNSTYRAAHAEKWSITLNHIPRLMIEMVAISSMLLLITFMILRGRELGDLMPTLGAFVMAAVRLLPSANRIVASINAVAYNEPSLNKLIESLDELELDKDGEERKQERTSLKPEKLKNEIAFSSVTFRYEEGAEPVLNNADLVIPIGKSVGMIGSSGSGKTTAIDLLLGLLKPEKGEVLADGRPILKDYEAWLQRIAYIPQSIFLLDASIMENIAFGKKMEEIDEERVLKALSEASLMDFILSLPEGIRTEIGERGVRLSGGQKQRIGIARALYCEPEILVFDEATSALDHETEASIMQSINGLHGEKTMVIIAHRLQTLEKCDLIYRVEKGKIRKVEAEKCF